MFSDSDVQRERQRKRQRALRILAGLYLVVVSALKLRTPFQHTTNSCAAFVQPRDEHSSSEFERSV